MINTNECIVRSSITPLVRRNVRKLKKFQRH